MLKCLVQQAWHEVRARSYESLLTFLTPSQTFLETLLAPRLLQFSTSN